MLIKPFRPATEHVPTRFRYEFNRSRIAVSPSGRARIEEIHIDTKNKTVTKTCSLGNFENYKYSVGNRISLDSSLSVMTDLVTGKLVDYKIKSQIPNNNDCKTFQTLGNDFTMLDPGNVYVLKDHDVVYPSKFVDEYIHESTFDPKDILFSVYATENATQMPYTDFIGLLDSFFTQWGFGCPFDSTVVIDTKTKEFTPKFTYDENLIDKDTALTIFAAYAREISKLIEFISFTSLVEKRHFRIKVFTNAYMSYVSIKDMDHPELNFDINASNCDHFRSLINNSIASKSYSVSEAAGLVVLNKNFGNISSDILETVDYVCEPDLFIPF